MNLASSYWRRYYDLGWSVIPVRENSKKPLVPWIKYQQERPDLQQITQWPKLWSNAGIAVVTGAISGIFVLDVDEIPESAPTAKEQAKIRIAKELISSLPVTATTRTAKGRHFYFKHPGKPVPTKVRFLPGLDVRGDGGYAILPPTVHPDGKTIYVWDYIPEEGIAEAPPELLDAIYNNKSEVLESATRADGTSSWRTALRGVEEGSRNESATALIGKMLQETNEELWPLQWEALKTWNREKNRPPMDERELRTTFESICKKERDRRGPQELQVMSVADLEHKDLPPPIYAVKNLIYGLTLLIAKPKIGKSTLALQAGLSVVAGADLFSGELDIGEDDPITWPVNAGPVIYLDLEDSETRLRERVRKMTGGTLPKDLFYALRATPMAEGGLKKLQLEMERRHPSLVIIDMFPTFAGIDEKAPRNAYQAEYRTMRLLWELSASTHTPILALQHARKDLAGKIAQADPFDAISGTLGASGAADTLLVMQEQKSLKLSGQPGEKQAKLYVRGRDVSQYEVLLRGDPRTRKWRYK